jgi:hypothetical protein
MRVIITPEGLPEFEAELIHVWKRGEPKGYESGDCAMTFRGEASAALDAVPQANAIGLFRGRALFMLLRIGNVWYDCTQRKAAIRRHVSAETQGAAA